MCRKRLLTILDLVQKQKEQNYQFIQQIHTNSLIVQEKMDQTSNQRHQHLLHSNRNNEMKSKAPTAHQYPPPPPPPPAPQPKINSSNENHKIQNLKTKIENQMRSYAKQEEYEEMLKLAKVILNLKFKSL